MSNTVFPTLPGITPVVAFTPQFSTKMQVARSGKEYRASLWANPKYDIQINFEFLRADARQEMQQLVGFYIARQGSFDSFLWTNIDDCSVTDQAFGTGDGKTTTFQLQRSLGPAIEPVQNVNVITNVKVAGTATTAYTVSNAGMVTFTNPPGAGQAVTWTGTYYYRCRFTADTQEFDKFMNKLWSADQLDMTGCLGSAI